MKVYNLGCSQSHVFEGWFGSEADFLQQAEQGLLQCPVCGDMDIQKRLSAPRLNLGKNQSKDAAAPSLAAPAAPNPEGTLAASDHAALQAAVWRAVRAVIADTEDVGDGFAREARKIHYGEVPERKIRGQATYADTVELLEEGIAVLPLPDMPGLNEPLQ